MLKALARWILREDTPATQSGRRERDELSEELVLARRSILKDAENLLEERLEKFSKEVEWEMGEWFDKFSTLHARASKRQQRAEPKNGSQEQLQLKAAGESRPSALHYRRPWSV